MLQELGRTPDYFARAERWNGHQPYDNCPMQERNPVPTSSKQIEERNKLDRQLYKATWRYLARHLDGGTDIQNRKFGPGTTFDANYFEDGTIIEIRNESGYWIDGEKFSYKDSIPAMGVVCELKGHGKKIALYYRVEGSGPYIFTTHKEPLIEVGKVEHIKRTGAIPPQSHDDVNKVNSVVILSSDNGRKRKKFNLPYLIPIPHMGPQIIFNSK